MTESTKTEFNAEVNLAENKENENSSASSTENNGTDQTGTSDQDKNQTKKEDGGSEDLDKHPRWKEREEQWTKRFNEQEIRQVEEIGKIREEISKISSDKTRTETSVQIPPWFGGDEDQWKEFLGWNQTLIGKAKDEARTEALKEIDTRTAAEQKAIDDATNYFNDQITFIESDKIINPESQKVDRNKLLKFVLDNDLVDSKGRWNYKAGFTMMTRSPSSAKNDSIDEKKKIAGATTSENRGETKQTDIKTSADFKKPGARPW